MVRPGTTAPRRHRRELDLSVGVTRSVSDRTSATVKGRLRDAVWCGTERADTGEQRTMQHKTQNAGRTKAGQNGETNSRTDENHSGSGGENRTMLGLKLGQFVSAKDVENTVRFAERRDEILYGRTVNWDEGEPEENNWLDGVSGPRDIKHFGSAADDDRCTGETLVRLMGLDVSHPTTAMPAGFGGPDEWRKGVGPGVETRIAGYTVPLGGFLQFASAFKHYLPDKRVEERDLSPRVTFSGYSYGPARGGKTCIDGVWLHPAEGKDTIPRVEAERFRDLAYEVSGNNEPEYIDESLDRDDERYELLLAWWD